MTDTTVTEPAQPSRIPIDPIAVANEAQALNDFLTGRSLQNANNAVMLMRKVRELEAAIADQTTVHAEEMERVARERDETVQRLQAANAKIIEIQTAQALPAPVAKSRVKVNA